MKALVIDINKCNGCYNCQIACKDEHVGNDWTPIAKPQPDIGQFWHKVTDVVQGTVPKVRVRYMHEICQHCDDAPCVTACKAGAVYKRGDGTVVIDPERCTGAKQCIDACPYGVVYFNTDLNIAQKCTFCAHLLDTGWTEPRCVDACPTGALTFGEEEDLKDLIAGAEILSPEAGVRPRVFYIGLLNKYFVTGAVYDPYEDECLIGATVTLEDTGGRKTTVETDFLGDFWFERQEPGVYSLRVEMESYLSEEIKDIDVCKDANVGDIALRKSCGE